MSMKVGQRVYFQFDPETWGTVTAVDGSRFRVTWFDATRKSNQRRVRHWYEPSAMTTIRRGEPS